ncbi:M20 metallopeptidase family protein [Paenibacillus sp. Leaf72]|uniref:M20 metallopeptidase family protein n=1 Tax=Paenibacillus sp. Leaf72 TaxID=1736234 RepID=UPI0006FB666E|nr:amidohydrolase [Paenibacillus sp. Leaf72]KQO04561.1 peptidase M20 [Paenibacillus sp. Leaf72]
MLTSVYALEKLQHLYPEMVQWRRYLHQHPELSFQEEKTSRWIAGKLAEFGCEFEEGVGGYGIVVTIKGEQPGPVVALRADIDALPIQDEKQCDYASTVPGIMHACGHDGHTSSMLAIAKFYQEHRSDIKGERRLLFQPAEEVTPGGAIHMIRDGALAGVDVIYGIHLWAPLPFGQVSTRAGAFMAAADEFTIEIIGLGGHGGMPHKGIDTIVVGASLVQSIQSIVSRSINPLHPSVISIGSFQAGTTNNVIAERCLMKGTVRSFDEESRYFIHERLKQVIEHTCQMYGAKYDFQLRVGYPAVINNEHEAERFFRVAEPMLGEGNAVRGDEMMVAEDFSYYLDEVPGCFMMVGAGNGDTSTSYSHHHPKFDFEEGAMLKSAELLIRLAEDYVSEH